MHVFFDRGGRPPRLGSDGCWTFREVSSTVEPLWNHWRAGRGGHLRNLLVDLVRPIGLEPITFGSGVMRLLQLSAGRTATPGHDFGSPPRSAPRDGTRPMGPARRVVPGAQASSPQWSAATTRSGARWSDRPGKRAERGSSSQRRPSRAERRRRASRPRDREASGRTAGSPPRPSRPA